MKTVQLTGPIVVHEHKHGLGRISAPDLRDHKFALRAPARVAGLTERNWYNVGIWDQGQTSMCVAYSSLKWLNAGPVRNTKGVDATSTTDFYRDCQRVDEWPGENYDGTSVRASMKVLQERGYINSYSWAFDIKTAANFILTTGPMIFGTVWSEGMFNPDSRGFLPDDSSAIVGGHSYLAIGANTKLKTPSGIGAFRIVNSWSKSWGQGGRAWLPFSLADKLFKEDGEAACALELKK